MAADTPSASHCDPRRDSQAALDGWHMARALELAEQGRGAVEPNPLVGAVIARGAEIIADGWHRRFGGPHAEIEALRVAGRRAAGATLYVTLEPCCHHGKTPPCTRAVIAAGIRRVVVAQQDPFPAVDGGGLRQLAASGVDVASGVLETRARRLNAPYLKLLSTGRPWVLAKWAMTLDGRIATRSGASQWISGAASRAVVHKLRGRVDAILVGRGTAAADDPLLTARPSGARLATRIVLDSTASLAPSSRLVASAGQVPLMVAASPAAPEENCRRLSSAGCEVFVCQADTPQARLLALLEELGRRRMTNVLVEGGQQVLGSFFDAGLVDEIHVFIGPKLFGGADALSPLGGTGVAGVAQAWRLDKPEYQLLDGDVYLHGHIRR